MTRLALTHLRPFTASRGLPQVVRDVLLVGGTSLVCQVLGVATSLLLRFVLSPAQMGIWQGLKLALSYGNYANLGVSKAAARELTLANGRGEPAAALPDLHLAHSVNTLASSIYACLLLLAAAWIAATGAGPWSQTWAIGLAAIALLAALQRYVTFQITILRAQRAFAATSRISLIEAVVTLIASVALAWRFGLAGLYAATLLVLLTAGATAQRHATLPLRFAWDMSAIARLISIGGPILLTGVAASLFRSLDKLMILALLDQREFQLGCYSLGLMAAAQMFGLANMLSITLQPRFGERFGRSGSTSEVAELAAEAMLWQAAVLVPIAAFAMLLGPPLLLHLLPDYAAGLLPLVLLLPGAVAAGLALPAHGYLVAINQPRRGLRALGLAMAVAVAANFAAFLAGLGLPGIAAATSVANFVYLGLMLKFSLLPELRPPACLIRRLILLVLPPLSFALSFALNWPVAESSPDLAGLAWQGIGMLALCAACTLLTRPWFKLR